MFTGLIETVGHVSGITPASSGFRVSIRTALAPDVSLGESVAVNGVCLTVTSVESGLLHADIGPETARVTTLGALRPDQPVNLERSMRADARFGGHFVQGHVDATGVVEKMWPDGDARWLTIGFPIDLSPLLIMKGSVSVDGISLTVAALRDRQFDVIIIPHTWSHTNLSSVREGDRVNLECDMLGKYVVRAAELFERTRS
jgi:riboflavin synthase